MTFIKLKKHQGTLPLLFRYALATVILFCLSVTAKAQNDRFADIGNKSSAVRTHLLVYPKPVQLSQKQLPLANNTKAAFKPMNRLDNPQKLKDSLAAMRKKHEPFLRDLTPALHSLRIIQTLSTFQWRKETAADRKNFQAVLEGKGTWEMVKIPHYGPPLGEAVTYYRTNFEVTDAMLAKGSLFLRFKGVDYKAEVFVNGNLIGSHEGIFAPFEFDATERVNKGKNFLVVKVYNDYSMQGNRGDDGRSFSGDKLYAATGLGYNDPEIGWHHCPAGMGIYQTVTLEARNTLQLQDIFVRPIKNSDTAEVWVEVQNTKLETKKIKIRHSLFGQNFKHVVYEKAVYEPRTVHTPGVGDLPKVTDNQLKELEMEKGTNYLKFKIIIPNAKRWNNETPWLYQLQLELLDQNGQLTDTHRQQFGMRSFIMDTLNTPKGMLYLNNQPIRLRGANTMGAFQQSVLKQDWNQLIDDILLAKITNMNYIRMTQMPVQSEIYDYCDRLGLMTQTDLPLFGVLKRSKWIEAVRQTEEMEKLVRSHPCNIMVTYINERFPNAEGYPQKNLDTYEDFERFFKAADQAILMNNPDRVIKAGDGDYDPPSPGLPDNHCYNGWYNGHGLGIGEMQKGHWMGVKPGWYYACGEFGSEGLDPVNTMRKYYPKSWLPQTAAEEKTWIPKRIIQSQTYDFHYMWYNTQHSLADWVNASQTYQATVTRLTTEAFRRDNRMVSFAIHLFIDAFPSGWMKSIMDVDRQPKKAWFEYAHALTPLAVQLRTDNLQFFSGDTIKTEAWIANDKLTVPADAYLQYQTEWQGKIFASGRAAANIELNASTFQGFIGTIAPQTKVKSTAVIRLALFSGKGDLIHETNIDFTILPKPDSVKSKVWISKTNGKAGQLANELKVTPSKTMAEADVILIDNFEDYVKNRKSIDSLANAGKTVVLLDLQPGEYQLSESKLTVKTCRMGSYYFVSPETGHPMVNGFSPLDFRFWYNQETGTVRPLINAMMKGEGWRPILKTGDSQWGGEALAVAEKSMGKGVLRVCQVNLPGRINDNPAARLFAQKLLQKPSEKK